MRKQTKYHWMINSSPPLIDQHSIVKHKIIKSYLFEYITTLMQNPNIPKLSLSIIDGFCGGGEYITENNHIIDGSPLIAIEAIENANLTINIDRKIERIIDTDFYFIDNNLDTLRYLEQLLKIRKSNTLINYNNIQILHDEFTRILPHIIEKIKVKKGGERAIFILDQYSYSSVPINYLKKILNEVKSSEIILTFNVDSLITFLSDNQSNKKALINIGLEKYIPWDIIRHIKASDSQLWRYTLQRHLADGIKKESTAKFMTLFFVKPFGATSWGYWLIHLSNNYRAHDVMKKIHWNNANQFSHELEPGIFTLGYNANDDFLYTKQETFIFGDNSKDICINNITEDLGNKIYLDDNEIKISTLCQKYISNTIASENHLIDSIRQLHSQKDIIIFSPKKNKRLDKSIKNYNFDDIIIKNPQLTML